MQSNQPAKLAKSHSKVLAAKLGASGPNRSSAQIKIDEERLTMNLERVKSFGSEKDLLDQNNIGPLV